jgi:hypothetical protein
VDYWRCFGTANDFVLSFAAILKVVCEEFEELKPIAPLRENKKEDDGNELFLSRWWEKNKKIYK